MSAIWLPVVHHYRVRIPTVEKDFIENTRTLPTDRQLSELSDMELLKGPKMEKAQIIKTADHLLKGKILFPGAEPVEVGIPFSRDDLKKQGLELQLASFMVPRIFIDAYKASGRNDFLLAARDAILAFAKFEREAVFPVAYLWNDHAIAARIPIIVEFWRCYRNHREYKPKEGQEIIRLLLRSGEFLSKRNHFTYATNHGIIQNLALWHLCLALPPCSYTERYQAVALERMNDQVKHYISDEGVFLEHSAGYHAWGLQFFTMAFRYLTLLEIEIPEIFIKKYIMAKDFINQLKRPDDTLPVFGDTRPGRAYKNWPALVRFDVSGQTKFDSETNISVKPEPFTIKPVSGYCIWWNGLDSWPDKENLSQTVISWSNFPGHGHKHADEMSILLWADGISWWTSVGYWPNGHKDRAKAISWGSSNAPFLLNEKQNRSRKTDLLFYIHSEELKAVDLIRNVDTKKKIRREIIYLAPNLWIILDIVSEGSPFRTVWLTTPDVKIKQKSDFAVFEYKDDFRSQKLTQYILDGENHYIRLLKGSTSPFAGWQAGNEGILSADALVIDTIKKEANSIVIAHLTSKDPDAFILTEIPNLNYFKNSENWNISLKTNGDRLIINRESNQINVTYQNNVEKDSTYHYKKPAEYSSDFKKLQNNLRMSSEKYSPFFARLSFRYKITYLIIYSLIISEGLFFICRKKRFNTYKYLRCFIGAGWFAAGILILLYLRELHTAARSLF